MKLISHLVAREAKLPEKPGLKMNTGGWGPGSFAVSRGQRGHFIALLGTNDLVFLYWQNQYVTTPK